MKASYIVAQGGPEVFEYGELPDPVAGPGEVPVHTAIRETGGTAWPIPDPPARWLFGRLFRFGLIPYPAGLIDFLKFPVSLAGDRFVAATGFRCQYGLPEIFASIRR